jgi:hypothetical protein
MQQLFRCKAEDCIHAATDITPGNLQRAAIRKTQVVVGRQVQENKIPAHANGMNTVRE